MTREERAQDAADLRAQGLTGIAIAEIMGISRSYAYELLNDPDGSRSRARKPHGVCGVCGGPTSYGAGGVALTCMAHNRGAQTRARQLRAGALPRKRRVLELWSKGWKLPEIAADLGTSKLSVANAIHRMRSEGWDLPYRKGYPRQKRAGAAQAVASTAPCPGAAVDLAAPAEGR